MRDTLRQMMSLGRVHIAAWRRHAKSHRTAVWALGSGTNAPVPISETTRRPARYAEVIAKSLPAIEPMRRFFFMLDMLTADPASAQLIAELADSCD